MHRCETAAPCFLLALLLFWSQGTQSEPVSGSASTWTIRTTHQILSSIEDQLQSLKYGWENSVDQLTRKIESLESKITRLDSSNQFRLEKLTESVNSNEIKEELAMEQLLRKSEANQERLIHKLTYVESRLDATLNKIQGKFESTMTKLESRQNDIESEIMDVSSSLEEIKSLTAQLDDKHNNSHKSLQQHLQTIMMESVSRDQMEKLSSSLQDIGNKLNNTMTTNNPPNSQNDGISHSAVDTDKIMQEIKTQVGTESNKMGNKISNMYNDLWRRFMSLEMTVKGVLTIGNNTRRQLQEDFRSFIQMEKRNNQRHAQENYLEVIMDSMEHMIQDLGRKIDNNFQVVITTQNLFMDNCHRLQLDEPQLEFKLSLILDKIFHTVTNKTMRVDNRLVEVMEMIKSHQSQVMRNLGHTTKMVVALTEETNQDSKQFQEAIFELVERNDIVAIGIQELQQNIQELANITKQNTEIYTLETCMKNETSSGNTDQTLPTEIPAKKPDIKFIDSDDVIKIFTEDRDEIEEYQNSAKNSSTGIENTRKISIMLPSKHANQDNSTYSRYYRALLSEFINQSIPTEVVEAIILNTEGEKENTTHNDTKHVNTTKLTPMKNHTDLNSFSQNLTEMLRNKLEYYKNSKLKTGNQDQKSVFPLVQPTENRLKTILDRYRKWKFGNSGKTKTSDILSMQNPDTFTEDQPNYDNVDEKEVQNKNRTEFPQFPEPLSKESGINDEDYVNFEQSLRDIALDELTSADNKEDDQDLY